jgi:hypothetical protein
VTERPVVLNVWSGAATVLVVAALVSFVSVMSGPYTSGDSKIFYSLGATLLAGSTFFAAFVLIDRDVLALGFAALLAAPFGWILLTYAIWAEATSTSNADTEFWTGIVVLLTALIAATARLLAETPITRALAIGVTAVALLAAFVSLSAAWRDEQFWKVGTSITSLWIVATALFFLVPVLDRALRGSPYWLAAAVALVSAALAGILAVGGGSFAPQGYSIFFTLIAAVGTAAAFLGGVLALERGARIFGWSAVALSPLAFAMLADGIWNDSEDRSRFVATGIVLGIALLVSVTARLFASTRNLVGLAGAAGILAATSALISIDGVWRQDRFFLLANETTALWILATLCCLLVPLLGRYVADVRQAEAA